MRRDTGAYIVAALLLGPAAAGADTSRLLPKTEVTLMGGAHRYREGLSREDHHILRASAGRYLTPRNGIEAHITLALRADASRSFPGEGSTVRTDALLYGLDYVFYLRPRRFLHPGHRFLPYLTAGVGGLSLIRTEAHSDRHMILGAGIGMKYFLSRRFAFHLAVRRFGTSFHERGMHMNTQPEHPIRIDSLVTGISVLL